VERRKPRSSDSDAERRVAAAGRVSRVVVSLCLVGCHDSVFGSLLAVGVMGHVIHVDGWLDAMTMTRERDDALDDHDPGTVAPRHDT